MDYKLANLIESMLTVFFQGGIAEFNKKGHVTIIPHPSKEIVVYHPDLSDELITKLNFLESKNKDTVKVMREKNFEGASLEEVRAINIKIMGNMMRLNPQSSILFDDNSNLIVITAPNVSDKDEILETIFASLRSTEGLIIAYVITRTSVFRIEPERSKQIPKIQQEEDRKAITSDDITNLIIELENIKSIDDLLK